MHEVSERELRSTPRLFGFERGLLRRERHQHGAELGGAGGSLALLLGIEQVDARDERAPAAAASTPPRRPFLRLLATHRRRAGAPIKINSRREC